MIRLRILTDDGCRPVYWQAAGSFRTEALARTYARKLIREDPDLFRAARLTYYRHPGSGMVAL